MKIAVIDSGVDIRHKRLQESKIQGFGLEFDSNRNIIITSNYNDTIGHGTSVLGIIFKHIPKAEFVCIKIFDINLISDEELLCYALNWCINNNVQLINLSLGIPTNSPSKELVELCELANKKNIIIVAATNNNSDIVTYPALLPTVLGVAAGRIKNSDEFRFFDSSAIELLAKGSIQRIIYKEGGYNISGGTSLACAHMTGIIGNIIFSNKLYSFTQLKDKLRNTSNNTIEPLHSLKGIPHHNTTIISRKHNDIFFNENISTANRFAFIGKLAVFPISEKELKTFTSFKDESKFEVTTYIDYPKTIDSNSNQNISIIKRLPDFSELMQFDTLVVGYYDQHLFEVNIDFGDKLVEKCVELNKNFIVFNSSLEERINAIIKKNEKYSGILYMPKIEEDTYFKFLKIDYFPKVSVPVIAVIGTSNKQGKFTVQIRLKQILEQEGYSVSHISTEPYGELLGADYTFPIGYQSTVSLNSYERIHFLRILMKGLQEYKKPHVFITGTQGGLIPRSYDIIDDVTSPINYLFAIQPDAVICCINPEDSLDIINETVQAARLFTKAKLMFYALTPWTRNIGTLKTGSSYTQKCRLDKLSYDEKIAYFKSQLGSDVINVMEEHNNSLILSIVQKTFS